MFQISEIINIPRKTRKLSERSLLIEEIYSLYTTESERKFRKIENWARFVRWARASRLANTPENREKFKKTKLYLKETNVKAICFKLSHIPTKDLYFFVSVCRDKSNRGESVGSYIFGSTKLSVSTELSTGSLLRMQPSM